MTQTDELMKLAGALVGASEALWGSDDLAHQANAQALEAAATAIALVLAGATSTEAIELITEGSWDEIARRVSAFQDERRKNNASNE